jgi:transposase
MPRLSLEERYEVAILATLRDENDEIINSYGDVARLMQVSRSTVFRIVTKYNDGEELVDRPRSGRPRILSEGEKRTIMRSG